MSTPETQGDPEIEDPATELMADPEADPAVAETRRLRPGEVVVGPALPFERPLPQRTASADGPSTAAPGAGEPGTAPAAPVGPSLDELNEIVWRSKVGIDPNDLPSAQLVLPRADGPAGPQPGSGRRRMSLLPIALLALALVAGFAVVALALGV